MGTDGVANAADHFRNAKMDSCRLLMTVKTTGADSILMARKILPTGPVLDLQETLLRAPDCLRRTPPLTMRPGLRVASRLQFYPGILAGTVVSLYSSVSTTP